MNFGIRFPFVVLSLGGLLALTAQPLRAAPNTYNHNVNNWNISNDVFSRPLSAPFASWARDREAHVTVNDVSRLVRDSTVTNTAAAALAAVHLYQLNHKNQVNAINRGLVEELAKSRTTTKIAGLPAGIHDDYLKGLHLIHNTPKEIFAEKTVSLQGLWQGRLADCFLVASVGAAVHRNPEEIKKLFHLKEDSCELVFPGGEHVVVHKLTDAELAMGSTCGAQGRWMPTLERGIAELLGKKKVAEDNINYGDPDKVIALLTGHKGDWLKISSGGLPTEQERRQAEPKVRKLLESAKEHHRLLVAGSGKGKVPPGMADEHDYAVFGFDAGKKEVHLWNPWSNNFSPKGSPGLENGYPTKDGQFTMPLKDFLHVFRGIAYETDQRAARK